MSGATIFSKRHRHAADIMGNQDAAFLGGQMDNGPSSSASMG
jgi:hypothetical protein